MANGSSRLVPALVALLAGLAIGSFITRRFDSSEPSDKLIRVHGDGSVSLKEANISKSKKHVVGWVADAEASLVIAFPEKNFPNGVTAPPFEKMTSRMGPDTGLKEWIARCNGDTCFSGNINKDLPDGLTFQYKYDQIVGGKRTDGMIIIKP